MFCTPDLDTLFSLGAPQPFVQLYALALGKPGSIVMTVLATLGLLLVRIYLPIDGRITDNMYRALVSPSLPRPVLYLP